MITDIEVKDTASTLGIEVATLKAVILTEGSGAGFLPDGRVKILFERHIFFRQLKELGKNPYDYITGNQDILDMTPYSTYGTLLSQWDKLDKAKKINEIAALKSASWGIFQIMGFNYKETGCNSLNEFVTKMNESELSQIKLFINYIVNENISSFLVNKDWAGFAKKYNGAGYSKNKYDIKLQENYCKSTYLNSSN
jgi:hypothetical protein